MASSIVYFQQEFPNLTETFVRAEVTELLARDYDVTVLCLRRDGSLLKGSEMEDRVKELAPNPGEEAMEALVRITAEHEPRYLHAPWSTEAKRILLAVAERLRVPFGFSVHAADIWKRGNRLEPEELGELAAHELCVTVAVEGSRHREYLRWCGAPDEKIIITPNSVDAALLPPPRETPPSSLRRLISIGRPVPKKGFYTGIDALRLLRIQGHDIRYEIVGGGDTSSEEGQKLAEYSTMFSAVICTGMLAHDAALEKLRMADALLVPSIVAESGDSDGIPTVITEAMVLGVPVVATDIGSISDLVIDGETGFLARAGDAVSIAEKLSALGKVLADPENARALLDRARTRARRHETQASVNTLCSHLERALGRFH